MICQEGRRLCPWYQKDEDGMSAKAGCGYALLLTVLYASRSFAEVPPITEGLPPTDGPAGVVDSLPAASAPPGRTSSSWLTYQRPDCCGPLCDGPITYELYSRSGASVPVGGGFLANQLDTGWRVQGGGRSLFFNTYQDAAWVIDVGLSYQYNHADHPTSFMHNSIPSHVSVLDRTFADLGFGRELYLVKAASCTGPNWRVGWDLGGRWGSTRLDVLADLNNARTRLPDTIGAVFASLHTDLELPCGCCTFLGGFRAEYGYTWQDVLPQTSDVQDVNFLLNLGVRF